MENVFVSMAFFETITVIVRLIVPIFQILFPSGIIVIVKIIIRI
jgi:hypothetical protein